MENKKRRKESDDNDMVEEDEEKKMDKFYSLLRSFKDARDRRQKELQRMNKNMHKTSTNNNINIWVPSFEEGDFATQELHQFIRPLPTTTTTTTTSLSPIIPNPCQHSNKEQHHHDDAIDLNLSL
ncbi:hypothetical protein S245_054815 [Arachis hypogaea]|uniref:NIM1-interacting protein n=1 Tax=Arachis hypogaea TaxID=3818 RepID=A0A444YJ15_ARAHY|nr:uncharacterized protein DS421_16g532790 [Arachis hypogaea]RYR01888.1 hypothetical protein Ahy_B06g080753 [Arachis hypogaea]